MVYVKYEAGEGSELVLALLEKRRIYCYYRESNYNSAIIDYNHHVDWAELHFLLIGLHTHTITHDYTDATIFQIAVLINCVENKKKEITK